MTTRRPTARLALTLAATLAAALAATALTATAQDAMSGDMPPTTAPAGTPATAPAMTDNPQYKMWAKFKPGSSATIAGDIDTPMGKAHVSTTQTLKDIAPDAVTLDVASTVDMMGHHQTAPVQGTKVMAKEAQEQPKLTGTEDVTAMGKTFKCKVYEQQNKAGPGQAKIYVNDDVPGGVVKADVSGPNGKTITMTLTAMEAK